MDKIKDFLLKWGDLLALGVFLLIALILPYGTGTFGSLVQVIFGILTVFAGAHVALRRLFGLKLY